MDVDNMIVGLNLDSTVAKQDNKCLQCGKELNPDRVYFRMDQSINLYEVYCKICGIYWEKEDRKTGKIIEGDNHTK